MATNSTSEVNIADYCEIGDNEIQSANVHRVPRNLSPVKQGKKASYSDGEMSDGSCRIRLLASKLSIRKDYYHLLKRINQWNYKIAT